jgi:hypothetical protein
MPPSVRPRVALVCLLGWLWMPARVDALSAQIGGDDIRLELSPRICTLGIRDRQCNTRVQASWHASREQSLCLVILDRPEVKKCWERYAEGTYTIELEFSTDVTFELKDFELQQVLAAETIRVIREAIQYRHKRRQPWNVFG